MEKRFTIFDFFSETFNIFSVSIIFVAIVDKITGNSAGTVSPIYQYGDNAVSSSCILQFLFTSLIIESLKIFWYSNRLFKHLMALWRMIFMLLSVIIVMAIFILHFGWFPIDNLEAWGGFFVSFAICFIMSLVVMVLKTRLESKKFEEGLRSYQKSHEMGIKVEQKTCSTIDLNACSKHADGSKNE
jgi:hypothetical protein